jgi:anhydro-N-acetylmuramic acid kinase
MAYYVGLMSGTSMDGIDAGLAEITADGNFRLVATLSHPWPPELRDQLRALALSGENEIDRLGIADAHAGELLGEAVLTLLRNAGVRPGDVEAIGSHGQTIRHRPGASHPFTLQIGDPNRLAALTGITTIADFRRRDMAAGGQGAPLAPAFHKAVFGSTSENRIILNIGGIANLTWLPSDAREKVLGFDSGPGNRLMDDWIARCKGENYDHEGAWAATGKVSEELLERLLAEPYFRQPPPRSTGTETFNLAWLSERSGGLEAGMNPADVQATLLELTAVSISDAVRSLPATKSLLTCGGGAHNRRLLERIAALLPGIETGTTATAGIDPDWVEAAAFAWLAWRTMNSLSGNLPDVTGAREAVILGGIYPA